MPTGASFECFEKELNRLVESFGTRLAELKSANYNEAKLRDDFLNPFFRALGWDMENRAGLIQTEREVEIESATHIGGRRKRADYLFRTDKRARFVCEAKKPAEELSPGYAFQAKRYAWNKGVPIAVLTDFEELKIYVVGGKPYLDEPQVGEWKGWRFQQYPIIARELWELLGRDRIAAGSIDQALDALPKKAATGKGKARQQWLIKPDRTRALDTDFLEFLDETRRDLASDIYKHNDHAELLDGNRLTEACQRVIDRLLFLRICEDRDIDTGERLQTIVDRWRKHTGNEETGRRAHQQPLDMLQETPPASYGSDGIRAPKDSLWRAVVRHFRALDRRPPTHVPFFNGNLFKPHFTETLVLSDEWLAGFIAELSDDESPYLFDVIPVEILGSVYERFLGKVVRPHGKGITVEEKPEVRKAGGVYYTPRYIVDYIVEQTAGKLLDEISGIPTASVTLKDFEKRTAALRLLDPACGSGSFLIRAFERVCEHWQKRLTADLRAALPLPATQERGEGRGEGQSELSRPSPSSPQPSPPFHGGEGVTRSAALAAWQKKHRALCWVDPDTGDIHLTVDLKRRILTQNIYGVDLDAAAVEVTQLSLYLKMLEHENRTTLARERELFSEAVALLPPLQDNIKCGNSLIASDFSMMPEDLVRVRAFDWPVQFAPIMKAGGFDAVIGNPPWGADQPEESNQYIERSFKIAQSSVTDSYALFMERAVTLLRKGGRFSFIVPDTFLRKDGYKSLREVFLNEYTVEEMIETGPVFSQVRDTWCLIFALRREKPSDTTEITHKKISRFVVGAEERLEKFLKSDYDQTGSVTQVYWAKRPELIVGYLSSAAAQSLVCKIESHPRLGQLTEQFKISRGEEGSKFNLKRSENSRFWMCIPENVHRYDLTEGMPVSLAGLTTGKVDGYYTHPKIWIVRIQKMRWPQRIVSVLDLRKNSGAMKTLQVVISKSDDMTSLKYLQAILGSKLINFWCLNYLADDMNQTYLERLPIRQIDLKKPADKARHDKLVLLVDKLLGLMPKLRAATADSEKATLQNAVTATDQQIDALVYELYGLTQEEISLVEGA